jgi:peptidyl-prolyl cis-trans isomerase D
MALLGTLRDKMGTWVVVFVFVAISAFVLGDLFSGNSNILSWGKRNVGEIAGKEVTIEEYQAAIQERIGSFMMSNGYEPAERDMIGIRQQAWDLLIARHAISPQFEKVGILVTDKEVEDMINGKNIFPGIRQAFTNPETGEFDRAMLNDRLNRLKSIPQTSDEYIQWRMYVRDLKPARERLKYENLILKSSYVTTAEAEREYHAQSDVAEARYLFVPYAAVSETEFTISDEDLKSYYNKNKERFKTDGSRDMKYIAISVIPSADDSAAVTDILDRTITEFRTSSNDSVFAANNTDNDGTAFAKYHPGNVPSFISKDQLTEGNVIGPVLDGETYKVAKITRVFNDTSYAARAKHILIRPTDTSESAKAEAKQRARDILKEIKNGADFGAKAREFGTDGSARNGGDLDWFSSGQMVKPFESAVFSATKAGLLPDVVETDFGFHIIEVTESKTNRAYMIALVEQQILPSDASLNDAFRKAEVFAAGLSGIKEFEERAREQGYRVFDAKNISAGDRAAGTLGESRQIVQWLYRDASVGEVSEVFDLSEQYVVAVMTGEVKKGYRPLEVVKEEIRPEVRKVVQGRIITEKLKDKSGTLEEVAQAFGPDANVYSNSDLRLNGNAMPTVGFDPKAIGTVFSVESGKRSAPVQGENGVVIIEIQNITIAPELNSYASFKEQLEQSNFNLSSMSIVEAIRVNADIEDNRYRFY